MHGVRGCSVCGVIVGTSFAAPPAGAGVNVEFRVLGPNPVHVGETASFGVYVVSDSAASQPIAAAEIVFAWETPSLGSLAMDPGGAVSLAFGGFPVVGSNGLNESDPPADGDGLFVAFAPLGSPVLATPGGTLLTTLTFQTLQFDPQAEVTLPVSAGAPPRGTIVFDGVLPNTNVTGTLHSASIRIISACGPADLDGNGVLNLDDVNIFAQAFVALDPIADLDGNEIYNLDDVNLLALMFVAGCP